MDTTLILKNIARHIQLTTEEAACFSGLLQPRKLKRKEYLLREGDVSRVTAFVNNGCLRGFTVDDNGFEHILQFAPADWWIGDMYSLLSGRPGTLNIEALEATEVLLLPKQHHEQLYAQVPKFERFFRLLLEKNLVITRQRMMDNMSLTAAARYKLFCKQYPSLIERLPQKQVAAYIGVTPEFLSKMLKNMGAAGSTEGSSVK